MKSKKAIAAKLIQAKGIDNYFTGWVKSYGIFLLGLILLGLIIGLAIAFLPWGYIIPMGAQTLEETSKETPDWVEGKWVCSKTSFDRWDYFDHSSGFNISEPYRKGEPIVWRYPKAKYVGEENVECFEPGVKRCLIEDFNLVSMKYQCSLLSKRMCEIGREKKFSCIEWVWTKTVAGTVAETFAEPLEESK